MYRTRRTEARPPPIVRRPVPGSLSRLKDAPPTRAARARWDSWPSSGSSASSVAYRQHALPVAWHVVGAQVRESWRAHFCRLLRQLAPAVPEGTRVHVLCDQGLGSRDLWQQIVALGWHPVLRYPSHITFRPTGGDRMPARSLGGGPGTLWVGAGAAFGAKPLPGTCWSWP